MKIVTDSAADMPKEEAKSLGITVAPLLIQFPEGEVSSEDLTPDDFYSRLVAMDPHIPTTSQPSSGMFASLYRGLASSNEEILSIHISSGLSGTSESARLGAQQTPEARVTIADTMTLSGAERFQVLAAAWGAKAGWPKEKILERMKAIQQATELIYTLETLTYLARGGRIGRVQALAGALLKIKPIINVDKSDGKYNNMGRGRTISKALDTIVDYLEGVYGKTPVLISVLHGQFAEPAEQMTELVKRRLEVAKCETLRVSPVLGVHTGPGVVGAAVVPIHLMEGFE